MQRENTITIAAVIISVALSSFGVAYTFSARPACPSISIHYAPRENLETLDVAALRAARTRIDIVAYALTNAAILDALAEAARGGAHVRLYLDPAFSTWSTPPAAQQAFLRLMEMTDAVETKIKPAGGALAHLKSYCVDGALLRSGSANFSKSGETAQDNDAIFLRGENVCAPFDAEFAFLWSREK